MDKSTNALDLFVNTFITNKSIILTALWQHIYISLTALVISLLISIPLGIFLTRRKNIAGVAIGITGVFQTIPSIALFGFMLPFVGIGVKPTLIALVLYSLLPIVRNVYTGILEVNQSVVDAGRGMGMTNWQILWNIELPLALPVLMAGVRTAAVLTIGVTTIAAFIGAGGLGEIVFRGVALMRTELIIAGGLPAALLAVITEFLLKRLEIKVTPNKQSNPQKSKRLKKKVERIARV
ncbi:ABC transporter permease [Paenibacillus sp. N3.4]|uniref:ABC transporter permease n=1 Tax=Paenibacillus sp. N3.4 TaxID=2603222 RepID=UPI0011C7F72D|nr:ABC transporter permease [Paenibacillus sp. N3.4]TXK84006.1 ABC transporter permease [Paenibacillus sp. N3.4]